MENDLFARQLAKEHDADVQWVNIPGRPPRRVFLTAESIGLPSQCHAGSVAMLLCLRIGWGDYRMSDWGNPN